MINYLKYKYYPSIYTKALSSYIQIKSGGTDIKWLEGVVIDCDHINMSAYMLQTNTAPMMLQTLSSYYAYDQSRVFMSDNIYECIGVWFYILRDRYQSLLFGYDLSKFVDEAIGAEGQQGVDSNSNSRVLTSQFKL
jgi:hypothetical protein